MKKTTIIDSFKKRKLLFDDKTTPEQLISYGECYIEEGRYYEASEFFHKASYSEGLVRLKEKAKQEGDSFLFAAISRQMDQKDKDPKGWEEVGTQAMGQKKYSHAIRAFRETDNKEALKKAEEALKEVLSCDQA